MRRPPRVAGRRYLDAHDRDLYESDLAEEAANVAAYVAWLERAPLVSDVPDPAWDERDPYDRLKSEKGYIGE